MIVSASRRTDIPAFYSQWFINRIQAGYCQVPNPFNPRQESHIPLDPDRTEAIVFWTRYPRPLFPHLKMLDERGFRYYFLFTVLDYPRLLEPRTPPLSASLNLFQRLADRIGPDRVIWRYDPVFFSKLSPPAFHQDRFAWIAGRLAGYCSQVIVSQAHLYRKVKTRLAALQAKGLHPTELSLQRRDRLFSKMATIAGQCGMGISSCAQQTPLAGIPAGACIDPALIWKLWKIPIRAPKDTGQRKHCRCVQSRDIGMYESCPFGCQYCYATTDFSRARTRFQAHDPTSPRLVSP